MNKQELIAFEEQIRQDFLSGKIRHPIHLSAGNADQVIEIFKNIKTEDWVFSNHRSHYHALLKGIPKDWLREQIHRGNSMHVMSPKHKFFAGAIVAGCCPIAVGVAMAIKRKGLKEHVWVFVGDMAAESGIFNESLKYAYRWGLPIKFIIEDNNLSTNTPTSGTWNWKTDWADSGMKKMIEHYVYVRECPHINVGQFVSFY